MANGDSGGRGPWWIQLIQTIGPTAAIAVFLVYVLAAQVTPALNTIETYMSQHVTQMQSMTDTLNRESQVEDKQWADLRTLSGELHIDRERALAVAEQSCINAAKSPYQTQQCINARNQGEAVAPP